MIHELRIATLGAIVNQELGLKEDIRFYSDFQLTESVYELKTHKAIVRAILRLKERNEPITMITVKMFLKEHGIPKTINEEQEIIDVFAGDPLTKETFIYYMQELKKNNLKRFRV